MRRRILSVAIATATLSVLLLAVPLGVFVEHGYVNDERLELQRAAVTAAAALRGDRPAIAAARIDHSEVVAGVYDRAGHLVDGTGSSDARALIRVALRGTEATATLDAGIAVAAPVTDGDHVVAAVLLRTDLGAARHRSVIAWLVIAAIGVSAVIVSAAGAGVIARRLSKPVDELRAAAGRIGAGDLGVRVPLSGVAEFDVLAATLNDSASRIQTMIGRERSLSAEVSHQLRTPLSGLRLELEALRERLDPDPHVDSALDAVDRLDTTITDIITLARDLPGREVSNVPDLVTAAEHRWHASLAAVTRPLRVVLEAGLPDEIGVSARAATQIIDILIDNAQRHGQGAVTLRARSSDGIVALDVSDEGPALIPDAHELFRGRDTPRDGGIGLPFARRLAEAEDARVVVTSREPPTFSLMATAIEGCAGAPNQ